MRLRAFSIIEVTVSMVVTAIIIGLVFIVFSILSEQMLNFKLQSQEVSDLNRFCYAINKDIFEGTKLNYNEDGQLTFYNAPNGEAIYQINENQLIRVKEAFKDTFYLAVNRFRIDTLVDKKRMRSYQRLAIEMKQPTKYHTLFFFKRIDPVQLLEKEFENRDK